MRRILTSLLVAVLVLGATPVLPAGEPAPGSTGTDSMAFSKDEARTIDRALHVESELVRLVARVRPSSVTIENFRTVQRGTPPRLVSGGSGVIISGRGYILTNQHVVAHAEILRVVLIDGRQVTAHLVGHDPRGDVALLRIDARGLHPADPNRAHVDRLSPGDWVLATGNPFFLALDGRPVVTLGVISGLGRVLGGKFMYGDAIQHDAEINPGNSGGPLWDTYGNFLGLNGRIASTGAQSVSGASSMGIGFTIPIDQIRNFFEAMMEGKEALHGDEILGVKVENAVDSSGEPKGARVTAVEPGSPAALARGDGIQVNDVIWRITVGGHYTDIETVRDFLTVMSPLAEGTKVSIHVRRGHRQIIFPRIDLERTKKRKGRR